ncbi:MAG: S8 family serine peptidase [Chloroflexi bacterium]|nr:S8 family serine peptidase [Chloroflexota bacterium]
MAVLDTGFDITHPDLNAKNTGTGRDFVNDDFGVMDDEGHGTAVSGIVGAVSNNGIGVAGLSWGVKIMPVKVCDAAGDCTLEDALNGIVWATSGGANILNTSFGIPVSGPGALMMQDIVNYTHNAGVVMVNSAGNGDEYLDAIDMVYRVPAELNHVIVVGATDRFDARCAPTTSACNWAAPQASAWGPQLDLMAPGSLDLWTTDIMGSGGYNQTGDYNDGFGGTSAAAPHVAGTIALMLSVNPASALIRWKSS